MGSEKIRFAIVGSGWRSLFYVRIAKALPEKFELLAMLCRTQEKADKMAQEHGIRTSISEEEVLAMKPDFIVSAVNKASMNDVARYYASLGFAVLSETPAALNEQALLDTWEDCKKGYKLQVAEQYFQYPIYANLIKTVESGIIGEPVSIHISAMHDYHCSSIIRKLLQVGCEDVKITGKTFDMQVTDTKTRYETLTDGKVVTKEEKHLVMEYESGKVAFYDFMSDQYRSGIRKQHILIRGTRGEICDDTVYYLNDQNLACEKKLTYENPYAAVGLTEDETAIATLMLGMKVFANGGPEVYPMVDALEDAYLSILMTEIIENPYQTLETKSRPWKNN